MKSANAMVQDAGLAEVQLSYRARCNPLTQPQIQDPQSAAEYFRSIWDQDTMELSEEFVILLLTPTKHALGFARIGKGNGTSCIVDPVSVFKVALLSNAHSIVCCHNHPSGNLRISESDKVLTKRLAEAGRMLGIQLEDHIILTRWDFTSFALQGLL